MVYPQAACRLATRYRLRRLGGASAGAIAAALAAAAEYHRQHDGAANTCREPAGFVKLAGIPEDLGANLGALFQPVRTTRPAHSILMAAVAPGRSKPMKVLAALARMLTGAPFTFGLALLLTLAPLVIWSLASPVGLRQNWWPLLWSALAWLPGALLVAVLATGVWVGWRTVRALRGNGFGLTNGHTTDGKGSVPPLTDWMVSAIDETAGLIDGPLTFGQLWGPEAVQVHRRLWARQQTEERLTSYDWRKFDPEVDLKVMTTNLTLRKPYEFPFSSEEFLYCPRCWEAYFPELVMEHLDRTAPDPAAERIIGSGRSEQRVSLICPSHPGQLVRPLPAAPDMPVVVAARLSLSFPGLISAVPMVYIDYSRGPGRRNLVTCWFSDGGIASNFPMHFFDTPWPRRPTFGLNLDKRHPDYPEQMVWRPQRTHSGVFPRSHEPISMFGFLSAVMRTMQNWVDASQITMPGFRDRVTELRTGEGEGGLNLRMTEDLITTLAERGSEAALEFADFDLPGHQWVRYRATMNALSENLDAVRTRWPTLGEEEGYDHLIKRLAATEGDYHLGSAEARIDARATARLMAVAASWEKAGYPATAPRVPTPPTRLRQMPIL
ncbi:MAG TPA: hypothetical protein VF635_01495 [Propionibacteriaceae bacterium]